MVFSMENQPSKGRAVSRPKDNSLESYKGWIMGVDKPCSQENMKMIFTDAELAAGWREYWSEGSNYFRG
jgi:hypothetical protein